jgi:hypothetical protein
VILPRWGAALGSYGGSWRFVNAGSTICSLRSPARAVLRDWKGAALLRSPPFPGSFEPVVLLPGRMAEAIVLWSNWCSDETELQIRIALPDDGGVLTVVPPGTAGCTGPASAGSTLSVEPFTKSEEGDIGRRTIAVQQAPNQVGVQAGAVWITGQDRLLRLDQEGRVVSAFELGRADGALIGGGHDVAFGEGAVWVTCSCGSEPDPRFGSTSGGVVRIDPETNRVSGTKIFTDRTPDAVVVGNDAVWLRTGNSVTRLSADDLRIEKTISLRSEIIGLAAGRKTLWALLSDDEKYYLASINTKTNQVVARVPLAGEPSGLADDGGTLWVTIRKLGQLWKFNGTGNGEVFNLFSSADGIAAANGSIWVTDFVEGVLSRVDASTGRVVAPFNIGKDPGPFAVGAGAVWLLSYADWTITRIPV